MRRFVEVLPRHANHPAGHDDDRAALRRALVDVERRIEARIAERVLPGLRRDLKHLLEETAADLQRLDVPEGLFHGIADGLGWEGLGDLVAKAAALASTAVSDPLNHVLGGYSRFRRYTPRMLRTLDIEASPAAEPLLDAVGVLRSDGTVRSTGFLRPNSRWRRLLRPPEPRRRRRDRRASAPPAAAPAAGGDTEASSRPGTADAVDVEPDAQPARRAHRRVGRRVDSRRRATDDPPVRAHRRRACRWRSSLRVDGLVAGPGFRDHRSTALGRVLILAASSG